MSVHIQWEINNGQCVPLVTLVTWLHKLTVNCFKLRYHMIILRMSGEN